MFQHPCLPQSYIVPVSLSNGRPSINTAMSFRRPLQSTSVLVYRRLEAILDWLCVCLHQQKVSFPFFPFWLPCRSVICPVTSARIKEQQQQQQKNPSVHLYNTCTHTHQSAVAAIFIFIVIAFLHFLSTTELHTYLKTCTCLSLLHNLKHC